MPSTTCVGSKMTGVASSTTPSRSGGRPPGSAGRARRPSGRPSGRPAHPGGARGRRTLLEAMRPAAAPRRGRSRPVGRRGTLATDGCQRPPERMALSGLVDEEEGVQPVVGQRWRSWPERGRPWPPRRRAATPGGPRRRPASSPGPVRRWPGPAPGRPGARGTMPRPGPGTPASSPRRGRGCPAGVRSFTAMPRPLGTASDTSGSPPGWEKRTVAGRRPADQVGRRGEAGKRAGRRERPVGHRALGVQRPMPGRAGWSRSQHVVDGTGRRLDVGAHGPKVAVDARERSRAMDV